MEINWKVTAGPTTEPVSLDEAKLHLRVDHDDDNLLITFLITAARQWCEDYERRSYITQSITAKMQYFGREIILPRPTLKTVTTVKYIDTGGDQQTLDSGVYYVDDYREPGRITLAYNQSWPVLRGDVNGVEVIYVAGYGDAAINVPARTRAAIMLLIGHLYENREETTNLTINELPLGIKNLLNSRTWM